MSLAPVEVAKNIKNVVKNKPKRKVRIRIDKSLNQYENIIFFPEKLEKTNQMLKNVCLPKGII